MEKQLSGIMNNLKVILPVLCFTFVVVISLSMNRLNMLSRGSMPSPTAVQPPQVSSPDTSPSWTLNITEEELPSVSWIVYNRVPKCGSTVFHKMIGGLKEVNNFSFHSSRVFRSFSVDQQKQRLEVEFIANLSTPVIFDRHIHFLDFKKFGLPPPVYVNIVRDPIDRLVSWYYYIRFRSRRKLNITSEQINMLYDDCVLTKQDECTSENSIFSIIPFFCGQEDFCRVSGRKSLHQAMRHVVDYYPVVGLTEDLMSFYQVIETIFPQFFKGVESKFQSNSESLKKKTSQKQKPALGIAAWKVLRTHLDDEYEFYHWIKKRFYEQKKRILARKKQVEMLSGN